MLPRKVFEVVFRKLCSVHPDEVGTAIVGRPDNYLLAFQLLFRLLEQLYRNVGTIVANGNHTIVAFCKDGFKRIRQAFTEAYPFLFELAEVKIGNARTFDNLLGMLCKGFEEVQTANAFGSPVAFCGMGKKQ